jgi:hypothetical protein
MKNKEFHIDGRKININFEVNKSTDKILLNIILNVCTNYEPAHHIRNLQIIISNEKEPEGWGQVEPNELLNGNNVLILYYNLFFENDNPIKNFEDELIKTLEHELVHLWHNQVSIEMKKILEEEKELKLRLYSEIKDFDLENPKKDLELILYNIMTALYLEGIVKYYTDRKEIVFSPNEYNKDHSEIKRLLNISMSKFGNLVSSRDKESFIKNLQDFFPSFDFFKYGKHIVYTILYANPELEIKDIMKLSYEEYFELYINSVKKLGYSPLFSLNSNTIFSYSSYRNKIKELEI